ncbi:MAG: site-specific DNA-methyltransferase, partial [Oscillatoriales cyanobacterium C42_A2020_001]|nr:site-specific DNA-methyltransferase [Leptolyngbyaceae cyanobacterium C42_A2020_001]
MPSRAPHNRTLELSENDRTRLGDRIRHFSHSGELDSFQGTLCGDCLAWATLLPHKFVDLLILDPPYNLDKNFHGHKFTRQTIEAYTVWLDDAIA